MKGILLHRRSLGHNNNTKTSLLVPLMGLTFHADETTTVISGTQLISWNNKVGINSLIPNFPAPIIFNDDNFNGVSSIDFRNIAVSGIDTDGVITDGATIIQVVKTPITSNGDGTMLWFWNRNGGPLDIWTANQQNEGLYLNTFNSTQVGNVNAAYGKRLETRIITSVLYNNNIYDGRLYENGEILSTNRNTGGLNNSTLDGTLYPIAYVPNSQNYNFYGYMSEFLFYNRVLTEEELKLVHSALKYKYFNYMIPNSSYLPELVLNEQDYRIAFVGQWSLENHPAYLNEMGKYIQNSNRDGYLQITVPEGYNRVKFEGIIGNNTGYGQFDYLRNNQILGSGSFYRDMQQQWTKDIYFDISVQPGDIIRQVFYGGTGFCDQITFYNHQGLFSIPVSYYTAGQSVEDDSADWVYNGNWKYYSGGNEYNGNCHYLDFGDFGVATLKKPAYCSALRFIFGTSAFPYSSQLEIRKYGTTNWLQQGVISKDGNKITLPELAYWEIRQKDNLPSDYTVVDVIEFS